MLCATKVPPQLRRPGAATEWNKNFFSWYSTALFALARIYCILCTVLTLFLNTFTVRSVCIDYCCPPEYTNCQTPATQPNRDIVPLQPIVIEPRNPQTRETVCANNLGNDVIDLTVIDLPPPYEDL